MCQADLAVPHHGDRYRNVFADGSRIDIDVHDLGLGGKCIRFAGYPIIKPPPHRYHQIADRRYHVGAVGAVHADHSQRQRV